MRVVLYRRAPENEIETPPKGGVAIPLREAMDGETLFHPDGRSVEELERIPGFAPLLDRPRTRGN